MYCSSTQKGYPAPLVPYTVVFTFNQYGLVTDQQNWDDVETYDSSGNYIPKKNIPWSELQAAFDCVNERGFVLDKQGTSAYCSAEDCNLRSELTECGWNTNSDPLREAIEWYGFDFENAVEPEHSSLYANPLWNYGYDFQYKDFFVTDPNGYCKIADRYINEKKTSRNLIKLKTVVKEVNWQYGGSYPVRISTPNGCFLAKKVISTVSVGVLDKNSAMFQPQLMQNVMAMKRVFKMSNYYKIFFQFDRKFWGDSQVSSSMALVEHSILQFDGTGSNSSLMLISSTSQFIQIATEERGRCNFWQSLHTKWRNKFLYGSNILFCTLTTETIESITNHEDGLDAALDSLLDPLRAIYGNSFVAPLKSHYFPWDEYEYSFGSYENWLPGGTRADFETFIAPVQNAGENVVYISGSATCERHWAYVHGALLAGERTAKMVLKDLGVPNIVTNNSMCDIAPGGGYGSNRPGKVRGAGAGRQLQG